jgi:hypothetical protein
LHAYCLSSPTSAPKLVVSSQTLYRHISPTGELRPHGEKSHFLQIDGNFKLA